MRFHDIELTMLISNGQLGTEEKQLIKNQFLQSGIKLVTVPPSHQWAHGKLSQNQIKSNN